MHEHLDAFGVINANARLYDPYLARFLTPDPLIQEPTNPQNFNRYSYCLNNPLKYTDPTGEFWWGWIPYALGAVGGGIQGYNIGKSSGLNGWGMFATTFFGAGIGAASAGLGSRVASSGGIMSNTLSVMVGSLSNSVGMTIVGSMFGQNIPISMSFGAGSVSLGEDGLQFGFLGKKGNSPLENVAYALGAMANVSDLLIGFKETNIGNVKLRTQNDPADITFDSMPKDLIGHVQLTGEMDNVLIDWGPTENKTSYFGRLRSTNNYEQGRIIENVTGKKFWDPITIRNINYNRMVKISTRLSSKEFGYNLFYNSCVSTGSRALNAAGILNIGIHPYLLHVEVFLRNIGVRPSLYSHYLLP